MDLDSFHLEVNLEKSALESQFFILCNKVVGHLDRLKLDEAVGLLLLLLAILLVVHTLATLLLLFNFCWVSQSFVYLIFGLAGFL